MKFDYTLTSPEERTAYVEQLLKETPPDKINNKVLGYMSDYILFVADKNQTKKETTTEALNGAASFIRGKLSERVEVRHTPELKFIYDTSIEYGNHIDKIIESINKEENNE